MPNTTICCNSTLFASSPLGYTGSTAFQIHTQDNSPASLHSWPVTCIRVSPVVLNSCSQREFTLFSPTSPHLGPQIPPPKWSLPARQSPFPQCCKHVCSEGQGAIGKGPRRDAAERNGFISKWKVKDTDSTNRKELLHFHI